MIFSKFQFINRAGLSRRDVIHEAIQVPFANKKMLITRFAWSQGSEFELYFQQVANIADLYFKTSLKARLSIVYVETWEDQDQVEQNDENFDRSYENENAKVNVKTIKLGVSFYLGV